MSVGFYKNLLGEIFVVRLCGGLYNSKAVYYEVLDKINYSMNTA